MPAVDRVVHAAHFIFGNFPCELTESRASLRMFIEHGPPHKRHRFIRRKIVAVILPCGPPPSSKQAARWIFPPQGHPLFPPRAEQQNPNKKTWVGPPKENVP